MLDAVCNDASHVLVRTAEAEDLDAIYALDVATFAIPWSKDALHYDIVENDNSMVLVAEYDGEFAGYADIWTVLERGISQTRHRKGCYHVYDQEARGRRRLYHQSRG